MQHLPNVQLGLGAFVVALVFACVSGASLRKADVVPKKDLVIKDPLDKPIADQLDSVKAPSKRQGPQYDHMYYPVAPKARRDLSPTDPYEYISGWEGDAAKYLDVFAADESMRFEGSTCESACAACSIHADQLKEGNCVCYADCKMGDCGGTLPHIGWSNNQVSTPVTLYSAQCNHGAMNCEAQCMKKELKKQLKECQEDEGNPADCYRRLAQLHKPLPHDARKQVHYCIREGMSMCDTFRYVPQEGKWECYDEKEMCTEEAEAVNKDGETLRFQAPTPYDSVGLGTR